MWGQPPKLALSEVEGAVQSSEARLEAIPMARRSESSYGSYDSLRSDTISAQYSRLRA
jgi:hypothetical protein